MEIHFDNFTRRSFDVEAVQITEENIHELARFVGEVKSENGIEYIVLDRRIVPTVSRAYIGWWVTRMNDNMRCYSNKTFHNQFEPRVTQTEEPSGIQTVGGWHPTSDTPVTLVTNEPADGYDVV